MEGVSSSSFIQSTIDLSLPDLLPGCTVRVYKGNNVVLPNFLIPAFEAKLKAEMERQRLGIAEAAGGVSFFYPITSMLRPMPAFVLF
jgi:hypothetical protein